MPGDLVLRNSVAEIGIARADGRIVSWRERATGEELLRAPIGPSVARRAPDAEGFLATVEETEEGHEALLYDPFGHGGIAVQIRYVLAEGEMRLAAELTLLNRGLDPVAVEPVWTEAAEFPARWEPVPGGFRSRTGALDGRAASHGAGFCSPFAAVAGEVGWNDDEIVLRVARPAPGAVLFVETEGNETFQSPATVHPERALRLPLGPVRPRRALLRGADGAILFESGGPAFDAPPRSPVSATPAADWRGLDEAELSAREERSPRHLAFLERARRAAVAGRFAEADAHLESALLTNGEDPLLWWFKAAIRRHVEPEGERGEWLNARFLRPLEPLVAAEAILAREAGPPITNDPLMTLVAGRDLFAARCVLAYEEAGLTADASALARRILAARESPRVRAILAALFLERGGMEAEAAGLWRGAASSDAEEPREREMRAQLEERFGPP